MEQQTLIPASTQNPINPDSTQGIAESILPYFSGDTLKNRYLSFRSTGFSVTEAITLAKTSYASVMRWRREDPEFRNLDTAGLSDLRDLVGSNYLRMEFSRNLRMFLEKDRRVIESSLSGKPMLAEDTRYLRSIRPLYTPQALAQMENILAADVNSQDGTWDLKSIVMRSLQNGKEVELSMRVGGQDASDSGK